MSTTEVTDRREQLLARLATQAEELASSAGWQRWLRLATRFRTYSVNNQLLIMAQDPKATLVAGYRAWNTLGRHVRKGERGIGILAPIPRRATDDDDKETRGLRGVRVVYVFDVRQTDGEELPHQAFPGVRVPDIGIRERLVSAAEAAGLTVALVPSDGTGARGWYTWQNRTISLVEGHGAGSQVRTLLHELAHACDPAVPKPEAVRGERELVAESAAFLVGTSLGLELDEASTHYVTSWGGDRTVLTHLAAEVLRVSTAVEGVVRPRLAAGHTTSQRTT